MKDIKCKKEDDYDRMIWAIGALCAMNIVDHFISVNASMEVIQSIAFLFSTI